LATLEPALDNLTISKDEKNLYITTDQSKIYQVDVQNGHTEILFQSKIAQVWDIAYDCQAGSLYVADFGSIKEFNAKNGNLKRKLILSAASAPAPGLVTSAGISVEDGVHGKIVITDITQGNVLVLNKDFTLYDSFNGFDPNVVTGLTFQQPFSTVRKDGGGGKLTDKYFATVSGNSTTTGKIVQFYYVNTNQVENQDFFTGLYAPVKLLLNNGYLYVVEAGDLLNYPPQSPGRISRIPLANPANREILVDNLNNPQGLDIRGNKMYFVEAGTKKLFKASATGPSTPTLVKSGLDLSDDILIYLFAAQPIDPPTAVAIDDSGDKIWVIQNQPNNVLEIDL
jgi:hypothetical protein